MFFSISVERDDSFKLIKHVSFISVSPAVIVPDGASERSGLADDLGSEEDLLYEEFRTSGHRFGHPGGGGGEQLAINEVRNADFL